jgi:hypothetical protein
VRGGEARPAGRLWKRALAELDRLPDEDISFAEASRRPRFARGLAAEAGNLVRGRAARTT